MIDFASPAFPVACSVIFLAILTNTISWSFLIISTIGIYKDFKNNNLKFSKVRYCFEMICFVVFFVGMGYIGVSKFVVDFIK